MRIENKTDFAIGVVGTAIAVGIITATVLGILRHAGNWKSCAFTGFLGATGVGFFAGHGVDLIVCSVKREPKPPQDDQLP